MQPKEELLDLVIGEVSLVDEGDNPPAVFSLWKRLSDPLRRLRDYMKQSESSDAIEKALFDDIREGRMGQEVVEVLRGRIDDLSESVFSIMFIESGEQGDPGDRIRESIRQFSDSIDNDLPDIMAGRIVKQMGDLFRPERIEVTRKLCDLFDFTMPEHSPGSTQKGEGMDLSKLSAEDRATVEAAINKETATGLRIAALEADLKKANSPNEPEPDPLEGLSAEMRKRLEPILKDSLDRTAAAEQRATKSEERTEKLAESVLILQEKDALTSFEKTVGDLDGLPTTREEIVGRLWKIRDSALRAEILKDYEIQAEAARRGDLFGEIGTQAGGQDGEPDAYEEIERLASELFEKASGTPAEITLEAAKVRVMKENPELYEDYLDQRTQH